MTPKSIAVINFKGGVGKTTVTWSLGNIISQGTDLEVLMLDLDPQMSLTEAIGLNESTGHLDDKFGKWYEKSLRERRTIYDALELFKKNGPNFKFPVGFDTIYQVDEQLHFVPSVEELYWLDLDGFDGKNVKDFIRRFIGKISNSANSVNSLNPAKSATLPKYDLMLFDCSPSFSLLTYSVLSCCDLVLIPVNPDYFGSRGLSLVLNSLQKRIEPYPFPKIAVFMNKAKIYGGLLTNEVQFYMREVKRLCADISKENSIEVKFLESTIRESVGLKRAINEGELPRELVREFEQLWSECAEYLK
ncbi:MAG: ParA family protein [Oscillatoriales cyanobacterium]|uniref:ParA family protein n=1 Tax=Microcoleus anatoxicus PTRS2 TaxID=2705321 RepID=A0ABU8YI29_9CYAN|nr:MAG: ParA family protein [Oscillatoriales cyanobacterium]TAD94344.1 MAG: ParA family protein [Oscillatoriales cyanobacterium]TAE03216.1 MAG: ParA family protein [Oscillatoriales cyanobacterium]TAF05577.1 MAG: ParA family protein [Oscillatoriales cyanobacterium]TAF43879.1 MAG: ParA family protein [Oscillatoriales cyanobacterium]